jgi:mRNA interferase RelE/StbE
VKYHLVLDDAALTQPLQDSLQSDVKKLTGEQHRDRLRIGAYRVLFRLDGPVVHVYAVKQRKEAYG